MNEFVINWFCIGFCLHCYTSHLTSDLFLLASFLKRECNIPLHCSIWLYWLSGTFPLLFCLSVSIPSSIFRCVQFASLLMILDSSQSISCWQIVACFANPPSRSFILFVALSTFPFPMSFFVSLTLSWCSFFLVAHFLSVSPTYVYFPHLHGISYITLVFLSPSGVFADETRSLILVSALFATRNLCFLAIWLNFSVKPGAWHLA